VDENDPEAGESGSPTPFTLVIADPRKFSEYVLVPDDFQSKGKHRLFLGRLGYRARNDEDARTLANIYETQARQRFELGDVGIGVRDDYGQRFVISIEVKGVILLSGWILRADGVLWLSTPFTGFARRKED
jgi:hypothetical protein